MPTNRPIRLTKPPDGIVTATIGQLTQEHAGQIEDIWEGILRETEQPDASWDRVYELRLAGPDLDKDGLVYFEYAALTL